MDDRLKTILVNYTDYELFLNEVNRLHWLEFEELIIDLFQKVFGSSQVEIVHTQPSHDGGRDGEGIFNIMPYGENSDFEMQFKIWIEVKKRTAEVTGTDIGLHALTALLNRVSLLIFVSNSSFRPQVKNTLIDLSRSYNIQHDLIEGERLFKLYQKHIEREVDCCKLGAEIIKHKKELAEIKLQYSKSPFRRYAMNNISVNITEPFYLFIEFNFNDCNSDIIDKYQLYNDAFEFIPYDTPSLINTQKLNGRITHTWIAYATKELASPNTYMQFDNRNIMLDEFYSSIKISKPLFIFNSPISVIKKINSIEESISTWLNHGKYKAFIVYGNAGTGKSYIINQLRYVWLKNGASEIILDGEIENSESVLLNRFIQDIFPIPIGLLSENQESHVCNFLKECQLPHKAAQTLANSICSKRSVDAREFNSDVLSDLLYFLIKRKSEQRKVIIVYEDLHKCQPSVVQLLIKTHRRLIYEGINNIFILLCSRKSASFKNHNVLNEWLMYTEEILEDQNIQPVVLEPYSNDEAVHIIQDTIFLIPEIDPHKIIEQVGTTPFGLKEALFYMYQKEWIQFDPKIDQFMLVQNSFLGLKSAIESKEFMQVTKTRISDLSLRIPKWAMTFMNIGACYGTHFNRTYCFDALGINIDSDEVDSFFSIANKLGLLKNSSAHSDYLRFDHDLIRSSLIQDIDEIKLKSLSLKLFNAVPDSMANDKLKAFLAFQAGNSESVEFFSERYGDKCVEQEVYTDALEAYKMTLHAVDSNMFTGQRTVNTSTWFIDDALNKAKTWQSRSEQSITMRNKKILTLCKKIIHTASNIGGGGHEIINTFTTEGMMLAKILNDAESLGIFHTKQGKYYFNKKNINSSISELNKALQYIPLTDHYNRGNALVELAISLRHDGKREESFTILKQALKEAGTESQEIKLRVFANAGGLYYNSNWSQTRRYWQKALFVAEESNNTLYWVHMLIDIGHLNLLDKRLDDAEDCYKKAYDKAHNSGLKGQEFKIHLHCSVLALLKGGDAEYLLPYAQMLLKQAEQLGIEYSIDRRLWRVYANWANIAELSAKLLTSKSEKDRLQLWYKAYAYDKKAIQEFEPLNRLSEEELLNNTRVTPLLVNILIRSLNHDYPKQDIFDSLDPKFMEKLKQISDSIMKNQLDNIPSSIVNFIKPLFGNYRFIFI